MKKTVNIVCLIGCLLFIIGIYFIFNSVGMGRTMLDNLITELGHSLDTEEANILLSSYITSARYAGTCLSCFGGAISIISGAKILKEREIPA